MSNPQKSRHSGERTAIHPPKAIFLALLAALALPVHAEEAATQRLSHWLLTHPATEGDYPLGLSWRIPEEIPAQEALRSRLLRDLDALRDDDRIDHSLRRALRDWVAAQPVTGRVPVALADARWLEVNPDRDPVLKAGHSVVMPRRPGTVTVWGAVAQPCQVQHAAWRRITDYVNACTPGQPSQVDWVWVVQPDGCVQRFGVASWNLTAQDEPAPGAWIWAPSRTQDWPESVSARLAEFLATQGPAPDLAETSPVQPMATTGSDAPHGMTLTSNDWGGVGLMQTPSARMRDEGELTVNVTRDYPYTQFNVSLQPFDWMEAGFRYSSVSNRLYGARIAGGQAYKDKSLDAKFRLMQESALSPQLALGFRDLVGTGLFSGEYLVASKRTGDFDWSLGLGWGYLGSRGNLTNPLSWLSPGMNHRPTVVIGEGGNFSLKNYFRGRTSLFGGVQYQTPWEPLVLKLEYDGNNYQHEPLGNVFKVNSPFNFGAVYRVSNEYDISIGFERGNTAMLGFSVHDPLSRTFQPKVSDPPPVPVKPVRPQLAPDWEKTSSDLRNQTGWQVGEVDQQGRELRVTMNDAEAGYWRPRLDRAVGVLHRDAPADVDNFTVVYRNEGVEMAEHKVNRDAWVTQRTQPAPPSARQDPVMTHAPTVTEGGGKVYRKEKAAFENEVGVGLNASMGGPNSFLLYQVYAKDEAKFHLNDSTWGQGEVRLGVLDNYDKFVYTAASNLPRVRTWVREFLTSSKLTVPNLQATHVGKIGENSFYSLYGGLLEEMYAGAGGEWLYRPYESPVAVGVDVNAVQMRGFKQDFSLQNYKTTTGHVSLYWDTGWQHIQANLSVGRYLAKDVGVSVQLSRHFDNGVTMGAGLTKTNVSATQFGEGSFDKWIRFTIPFDALMTRSSSGDATFTWKPLIRDGGAKLHRAVELYDLTRLRDARTMQIKPAPLPNEMLRVEDRREPWTPPAKGIEAYIGASQQAPVSQWQSSDQPAWQMKEALYRQRFRDIEIHTDADGRLDLRVSNDSIRPVSRAVGRAVRAALLNAPQETRTIHITFLDRTSLMQRNNAPVVEYEFTDLERLRQYLDGDMSESSLGKSVKVNYLAEDARQNNPLELLADTTPVHGQPSLLQNAADPLSKPIYRVRDDLVNGFHHAGDVNWLSTAAIVGGMVLASSLLDNSADRYVQRHAQNPGLKALNRTGNTLVPLVVGAGAVAAALSDDPLLSRTGYTAVESGGVALALSLGGKFVTGRARPLAGQGSASFHPLAGSSNNLTDGFPSGHSMLVWAVTTPFAKAYDQPWLYGVAGLTSLARVGSRNHWVSDTVAGSLLGYGIGKIMWEASHKPSSYYPSVGVSGRELILTWDMP